LHLNPFEYIAEFYNLLKSLKIYPLKQISPINLINPIHKKTGIGIALDLNRLNGLANYPGFAI